MSHKLLDDHGITAIAYQAIEVMTQRQTRNESMRKKLEQLDQTELNEVASRSHDTAHPERSPIKWKTWTHLHKIGITDKPNTLNGKILGTIRTLTTFIGTKAIIQ